MVYDREAAVGRRDTFFRICRERLDEVFDEDGMGRRPVFCCPWREPLWIMPALFRGTPQTIRLANRILGHYARGEGGSLTSTEARSGRDFNIFNSNFLAVLLHHFGDRMTPEAADYAAYHTRLVFRTFGGAAQSDYKYHGANDNMPSLATMGLILGGEALHDDAAVRQGLWNLHQLRRLLSRAAFLSEFNSSTYSALTLSCISKLAEEAQNREAKELALQIEQRLWAELLLHYHPGTLRQAGPQCRAYAVDEAGHNHSLQVLFWMAFGAERTGRDILKSCFEPDGVEIFHFCGSPWQNIAEYVCMLDTVLHVPEELAGLITRRTYPAVLRGRSECMGRYHGEAGEYHTETYMEQSFSLGTVSGPLSGQQGGTQTTSLYATYRLWPEVRSFKDAASVCCKYRIEQHDPGELEPAPDGACRGERDIADFGWWTTLQKNNTAVVLCTPNLSRAPLRTDTLKFLVEFPAHYGHIRRAVAGTEDVYETGPGAAFDGLVPLSFEAGETFIHIQPLNCGSFGRKAAVRLCRSGAYDWVELVNYEGRQREFSRKELSMALNGMVFTIDDRSRYESLRQFHRQQSQCLITDYFSMGHRFFDYKRGDVEFELVYTTEFVSVQTASIDGRNAPKPLYESDQLDVSRLPFMEGAVQPCFPLFPWPDLEIDKYPQNSWIIASRGLPGEPNYGSVRQVVKP